MPAREYEIVALRYLINLEGKVLEEQPHSCTKLISVKKQDLIGYDTEGKRYVFPKEEWFPHKGKIDKLY